MENEFYQLGDIHFFSEEKNQKSCTSICFCLFLRVCEYISAIFIGYLRNSPSRPFIMMLSVFDRKQY